MQHRPSREHSTSARHPPGRQRGPCNSPESRLAAWQSASSSPQSSNRTVAARLHPFRGGRQHSSQVRSCAPLCHHRDADTGLFADDDGPPRGGRGADTAEMLRQTEPAPPTSVGLAHKSIGSPSGAVAASALAARSATWTSPRTGGRSRRNLPVHPYAATTSRASSTSSVGCLDLDQTGELSLDTQRRCQLNPCTARTLSIRSFDRRCLRHLFRVVSIFKSA